MKAVEADALGAVDLGAVEWLRLCARLTPRVEQVGAARGLLDLGAIPLALAQRRMRDLLATLTTRAAPARAGIGPTSTCAQLALLMASRDTRLALVAAPQAPALLRTVPVRLLAQLHPSQARLEPEVIARLEGYGLRTLGDVARLEARMLCQHFGNHTGSALVALSHGEDLRPLLPTPLAHWHRVRLRWDPPLDPPHAAQAMRALPRLVERTVALLRGHAAGALRAGVEWSSGTRQVRQTVLRTRSANARQLGQEAERLLRLLLTSDPAAAAAGTVATDTTHTAHGSDDGIEAVCLWLGACAPQQPAQTTFWRATRQRQEVVHALAGSLARRHGRPLVLHPVAHAPAAIFAEDRYALLPAGFDDPSEDLAGHRASGPITRHSTDHVSSAWDDVPQRLHWW